MHADEPLVETDVVIIGAGPVGLFAVFELGLLEMRAHVVDALPHAGGQPAALYGDKPIYDIPGIPVCSGQQLTDRLMRQIAPFKPQLHLGQLVSGLQRQADGRFLVQSEHGLRLVAKAVFVAAGVGAFVPKRLRLEGIGAFEDRQLFYRPPGHDRLIGRHVVVVGGEDAALDAVVRLASLGGQRPASVTLLHRRDSFQAEAATVARLRDLQASGAVRVVTGQAEGYEQSDGQLTALRVGPGWRDAAVAAGRTAGAAGPEPQPAPMADWHLALERKQVVVDTAQFQTSAPGIFAVGDINTYPGKKKLILSGFHEATLAAYAAQRIVAPERELPFQYTTSSSRLHALLGVEPPAQRPEA